MMDLLLQRGANPEQLGHFGPPLGFAVRSLNVEGVKRLLNLGAKADISVPLLLNPVGRLPPPHTAPLLYVAMQLPHPTEGHHRHYPSTRRMDNSPPRGFPLSWQQEEIMALLLVHGASKTDTMEVVTEHLTELAGAVSIREEKRYLEIVEEMFKEAERQVTKMQTQGD
ncbi:hypothetical protein R3P38DRAFT_1553994 [Favolaschia claudopus]|uniref:Uncharacterized protein n=1 Tax=Favolaschia claudopus TaxID=2862362 RepID=A0AAW0AIX6_9AGAR